MSKKLAIKGHPTRGNEVIKILKMLGGKNTYNLLGNDEKFIYYISDGYVRWVYIGPEEIDKYKIFTLEEFLKKYPFKVGDFVRIPEYESEVHICKMKWTSFSEHVEYLVYRNDDEEWHTADELLEYNDDCMNDTKIESTGFMQMGKTVSVIFNDANYEDEVELQLGNYDIEVRDGRTYAVKKKPVYPKTYEECCRIMRVELWNTLWGENATKYEEQTEDLIDALIRLKVCRDAYWKIAGDEMGLGKPWKPDWQGEGCYVIVNHRGDIVTDVQWHANAILAFPTEEMRDAFYENFKDFIEQCKELL